MMHPQTRQTALERITGLNSPIHRLDPRAKILGFASLSLVSVSTPPEALPAFAGYFLFVLLMMGIARLPVRYVAARWLVIVPFVLFAAAFLPFLPPQSAAGITNFGTAARVPHGGGMILWNVFIKSTIGMLSVILLTSTTPLPSLLSGFEQLKVPRIFVLLCGFAYRYVFVLIEEAHRMKRARDSRGYRGRWLWHSRVIGQMIGAFFLRCHERAERIYAAMVSRGFEGRTPRRRAPRFRGWDYGFLCAALAFFVLLRIIVVHAYLP